MNIRHLSGHTLLTERVRCGILGAGIDCFVLCVEPRCCHEMVDFITSVKGEKGRQSVILISLVHENGNGKLFQIGQTRRSIGANWSTSKRWIKNPNNDRKNGCSRQKFKSKTLRVSIHRLSNPGHFFFHGPRLSSGSLNHYMSLRFEVGIRFNKNVDKSSSMISYNSE